MDVLKIMIIGWYGTETIGDRAILAGLISFFNKAYGAFEIKLGSLYPFLSERTLNEDYGFYKKIAKKDIKINIFNSKNNKELIHTLKNSDLVVMGGGPLMDLDELYMVEYAFKKAKKLNIKTALLGCGIGPLFQSQYQKSVIEIIKHSDLTILRDQKSIENLEAIYQKFQQPFKKENIFSSYDPAVECALVHTKLHKIDKQEYIAVNLRQFPIEYSKDKGSKNIDYKLENFINNLSDRFYDKEIRLVPMHYFHIGGDDRFFLNSIALNLNKTNIIVQNTNLNLRETIETFQNAYFNVGMRFHSIVLQTIVSGKNYILDYTEPEKGKISGFINDIDKDKFYNNRYVSLQRDSITTDIIKNPNDRFVFDTVVIENELKIYVKKLKKLLS